MKSISINFNDIPSELKSHILNLFDELLEFSINICNLLNKNIQIFISNVSGQTNIENIDSIILNISELENYFNNVEISELDENNYSTQTKIDNIFKIFLSKQNPDKWDSTTYLKEKIENIFNGKIISAIKRFLKISFDELLALQNDYKEYFEKLLLDSIECNSDENILVQHSNEFSKKILNTNNKLSIQRDNIISQMFSEFIEIKIDTKRKKIIQNKFDDRYILSFKKSIKKSFISLLDLIRTSLSLLNTFLLIINKIKVYNLEILRNIQKEIDDILILSTNNIKNSSEQKLLPILQQEKNDLLNYFTYSTDDKFSQSIVLKSPKNNILEMIQNFENYISNISNSFLILHISEREKNNLQFDSFQNVKLRNIVEFGLLRNYKFECSKYLKYFEESFNKTILEINNISQIAEYGIDTAIIESQNNINLNHTNVKQIAFESLERTKTKYEDNFHIILENINLLLKSITERTNKFVSDILRLTEISRIKAHNIAIEKDKFTDRFLIAEDKGINFSRKLFSSILKKFSIILSPLKFSILRLTKRAGLKEDVQDLSIELVDFLTETNNIIHKLPPVYKRLFMNIPLADERLYVERENNIKKISNAFDRWMSNKYSSLAIIGEKGAGKSTILNFVIKKYKNLDVVKIDLNDTIKTQKELINLFSQILSLPPSISLEDLTEKIFSLQKRKVIIFENFHKLFLRTVEGFEALHSFCELLSLVDEKLFLIISCNKFAWYYFDKVMNISDYFTHCVELEQLSKEKVKDIIFLRNNISGYPLKFLPTKEDLISRKFQKANEKERQDILCQNYFKKLNSIVKSNISLVQLFWLRSLELDENNTLQIKSLEEIDFSFLQTLSEIKYFTLMTFLQHNNLSVEEHSKIFHLTIDESKLILLALQDDGILINKGNQFEINFILYHHIIHLLQNKNIIH